VVSESSMDSGADRAVQSSGTFIPKRGETAAGKDPPPTIRRSNRNIRKPTRFAQAVRQCLSSVQGAVQVFAASMRESTSYVRTHDVATIRPEARVCKQGEPLDFISPTSKRIILKPGEGVSSAQTRYVQTCDYQFDHVNQSSDDLIWTPLRVLGHRVKLHKKRSVFLKVSWFSDEPTWESFDVVMLAEPYIVIDYKGPRIP
jgi:hypothetical protein